MEIKALAQSIMLSLVMMSYNTLKSTSTSPFSDHSQIICWIKIGATNALEEIMNVQ